MNSPIHPASRTQPVGAIHPELIYNLLFQAATETLQAFAGPEAVLKYLSRYTHRTAKLDRCRAPCGLPRRDARKRPSALELLGELTGHDPKQCPRCGGLSKRYPGRASAMRWLFRDLRGVTVGG